MSLYSVYFQDKPREFWDKSLICSDKTKSSDCYQKIASNKYISELLLITRKYQCFLYKMPQAHHHTEWFTDSRSTPHITSNNRLQSQWLLCHSSYFDHLKQKVNSETLAIISQTGSFRFSISSAFTFDLLMLNTSKTRNIPCSCVHASTREGRGEPKNIKPIQCSCPLSVVQLHFRSYTHIFFMFLLLVFHVSTVFAIVEMYVCAGCRQHCNGLWPKNR